MGHFEHSDCDCYSVVSKDNLNPDLSQQVSKILPIFENPKNFPSLQGLWLEQNCELSPLLKRKILGIRPQKKIVTRAEASEWYREPKMNAQKRAVIDWGKVERPWL